jgi:hypothetical protein
LYTSNKAILRLAMSPSSQTSNEDFDAFIPQSILYTSNKAILRLAMSPSSQTSNEDFDAFIPQSICVSSVMTPGG